MSTATFSLIHTPSASRWARSVGAIAAGLFANAILSTATDLLLVALAVFPPLSEFGHPASFSDSLLFLALVYRTMYGVLGCYVTAWFAPRRPIAHSFALGCIGLTIGIAGAIATWGEWTSWYSLAIIAVTLPCSWLGARLYARRPAAISATN